MHVVCPRHLVYATVLLFWGASASSITTAPQADSTPTSAPTCEARTINYITDSLPQLCFKSSWSNPNGTTATSIQAAVPTPSGNGNVEYITNTSAGEGSVVPNTTQSTSPEETQSAVHSVASSASSTVSEVAEAAATDLEIGELNDDSFLSFEEWKKQTLEKAGQADANIGKKKASDGKKRDSASFQNHLDSIGDEGEIDIDIGFGNGQRGGRDDLEAGESAMTREKAEREVKSKDQHRSKDAGRTCKERFSYASFDAGATILKTHQGAKNSKAVLIENKDSYMRSECSVENKFIIVELSEDIWIDTVVLANYEFFSSMFRHFRVSLSDKYPVKVDKWKDVGTYEARNSRQIQAFLIENPQIWARYMRIEFLSHYGNEYYCPLSLVRVHGTRMLESWRESEGNSEEEDDNDEIEDGGEEEFVHEAVAESVQEEERIIAELKDAQEHAEQPVGSLEVLLRSETLQGAIMTSPWNRDDMFVVYDSARVRSKEDVCLLSETPIQEKTSQQPAAVASTALPKSSPGANLNATVKSADLTGTPTLTTSPSVHKSATIDRPTARNTSIISTSSEKATSRSDTPTSTSGSSAKTQNGTNPTKNKFSSTSSASSSLPTIQESFFKAVSRRLNFLETNSTLSLKYIEEQSRVLREAFSRVEKKQMQKTAVFLETLNGTVLDELRGFRQQYDEIWQSTVISLESQREASRKEFLAISSRLNILADEVVFQKRMSIIQSVLLLLCLGLVIFSRVSGGGNNLDMSYLQGRMKSMYSYSLESPMESPLDSPDYQRTRSLREGRWLEVNGHKRQHSDEIPASRSRSRENSPPTPLSAYSRDDVALTPPVRDADSTGELISPEFKLSTEEQRASKRTSYHPAISPPPEDSEPLLTSPTPMRSVKRGKQFVTQSFSPPIQGGNWPLTSDMSPPPSDLRPRLSSQHLHPQLSKRREGEPHEDDHDTVDEGEDYEETSMREQRPLPGTQLPSPPPEPLPVDSSNRIREASLSITRKPLPALPPSEDGT